MGRLRPVYLEDEKALPRRTLATGKGKGGKDEIRRKWERKEGGQREGNDEERGGRKC